MRKLILSISLILIAVNLFAYSFPLDRNGKIKYYDKFDSGFSKTDNSVYSLVKEFFAVNPSYYNRSSSRKPEILDAVNLDILNKNDSPIKFDDPIRKVIIARINAKFTGGKYDCLGIVYITFSMKITIKGAKIEYEIGNFYYKNYSHESLLQVQVFGFRDDGNCGSEGSLENLNRCTKCSSPLNDLFTFIDTDTRKLMSQFERYIREASLDDDD